MARFGIQPASFLAKYGDRLLTPEKMPPADVELDDLPAALEKAATGAISIDGYEQPAMEVKRRPKRMVSEALKQVRLKSLEKIRVAKFRQRHRVG